MVRASKTKEAVLGRVFLMVMHILQETVRKAGICGKSKSSVIQLRRDRLGVKWLHGGEGGHWLVGRHRLSSVLLAAAA